MSQYTIFSLGDSAATIDFGSLINEELNRKLAAMRDWLWASGITGIKDIICAYSSLSVFYDPVQIREHCRRDESVYAYIAQKITESYTSAEKGNSSGNLIRIPVCYDPYFAPDLLWVASQKAVSVEDIIALHTGPVYRVYMIGFLPGFPYMATVDQRISVPRKKKPSPVKAGSIGLAGRQTGIYPLDSPGGWQIIGRTPLQLLNRSREGAGVFPVKAGDEVAFYSVSREEFISIASGTN